MRPLVRVVKVEVACQAMLRAERKQPLKPEAVGMRGHASLKCEDTSTPKEGARHEGQEEKESVITSVAVQGCQSHK